MSDTSYAFQVSIKTGEGYAASLINVPADSIEELGAKLDALGSVAGKIIAAERGIQDAARVGSPLAQHVTGVQVQDAPPQQPQDSGPAPWSQPQQQAAPSFSQPAQAAPVCRHGQMTFREGVSKTSGKPYKGFFCPSRDRNDQCPPQFQR